MNLVNSATGTMNYYFNDFKKQINPGFVMINPLYVEL